VTADAAPLAPWPPGSTSRTLELEVPVHVRDLGGPDGAPALLCVHGLGGSALNWAPLAPLLTGAHRVLAVDLPGHGGTPPPPPGDPLDACTRVLHGVLAETARLTGAPPVLAGHSLGGVVALRASAEAPSSVSRVVAVAPPLGRAARRGLDPRVAARLALLRLPGLYGLTYGRTAGRPPEDRVAAMLRQATPHDVAFDPDLVAAVVDETRTRAGRPDAAAADRYQWALVLGTVALQGRPGRLAALLDRVPTPLLWLQGTDDPLSPAADGRGQCAARPGWRYEERAGVGHLPHVEDPAWTAEQLLGWLPTR
jgi:pimeloyl-ACP methyl ester carboxylesterase